MWLQIKRFAMVAFVATALPGLAACGFRPLYAQNSVGVDVAREMERIDIAAINSGRLGHNLRGMLVERLTPRGTRTPTEYVLEVQVRNEEVGLTVERDETFSRRNQVVIADYKLLGAKGDVLTEGTSRSVVSSSISDDPYATYVTEKDVETRAVESVADNIRMRLALFFDGIDK